MAGSQLTDSKWEHKQRECNDRMGQTWPKSFMWIVFAHFVGEGAGTVIDFRLRLRLLYINDIFQAVMAAYNLPQDLFPTFRRSVECFNYYYVLKHVTELWFLPTVWSNCLSCLCQNSFQFYCIRVQFYSVVKLHYIKVKYHSELESRCKQTRVACWRSKWGQSKKKWNRSINCKTLST